MPLGMDVMLPICTIFVFLNHFDNKDFTGLEVI